MTQSTTNRPTVLQVQDLKQYFFRGRQVNKAVNGISFEIKKGEVFGLVGESGCGKTTTGRTIVKLYPATSGNVYLNGKLIVAPKNEREKLAKSTDIQMIFQDPVSSLNPRMTVFDIIAEGLVIRGERDKEVLKQKVFEVLELVGLVSEHANRYPHEFSGGQRQRIGIARAVVLDPEILIADEPVSALDVSIQAQVINLLNDLRVKKGLTILFIAHNLSVVKYFSDRIAVMHAGKIVEQAPTGELFANPCHPYTQSLISAIPLPDPMAEANRQRIVYNPLLQHNYQLEKPSMRELYNEHLVYCNQAEFEAYLSQYKAKNA
jgi:oligopeptide transport system ATP-binding protein